MKTPKERDNLDLLTFTFELHGRTLTQPNNKLMHDAYVEARQELESRLEVETCNKPAVINNEVEASSEGVAVGCDTCYWITKPAATNPCYICFFYSKWKAAD